MVFAYLGLSVGAALLAQYASKKLLKKHSSAVVIILLYLFCALIALGLWVFNDAPSLNPTVFGVGIVNAFGAWAFAQAIAFGLTQTFLFLPLSSVFALILSAIFLGEWQWFDPRTPTGLSILLGIVLSLSSILFFNKKRSNSIKPQRFWILALISFVIITGAMEFSSKFFATNDVRPIIFTISWYAGSFVGAIIIAILTKLWRKFNLSGIDWWWGLLFASGTIGSLVSMYQAFSTAPLALILPLHAFLYTLGGALMGLFMFQEKKHFGKQEKIGLLLGTIGSALLIFGIK